MLFPASPRLHGLENLYDDKAQEVFERWKDYTLDDLTSSMPAELETFNDPTGHSIKYVDLIPEVDFDEEHVVSIRLPIANGWRPHMFARTKLLQDLLPSPQLVRVFPNDTRKQPTLDVSKAFRKALSLGNVVLLARLQQRSLDSSFKGKEITYDMSGYSLGGTVAIEQASLAPTRSLDFMEIASGEDRTTKQLGKDTLNGSLNLRKYNEAIIDTGIPALAEAFGVNGSRTTVKQFIVGGASFALDTMLANNKAIKQSLTHRTSVESLETLLMNHPNIAVIQGRGAESEVMSKEAAKELANIVRLFTKHKVFQADHYAHEAGDNIWIPALLSRQARILAQAS